MDRAMLQQHRAQAEEHVALGKRHIARQLEIIAELTQKGLDTSEAKRLLALFEQTQEVHISHLDRINHELTQEP